MIRPIPWHRIVTGGIASAVLLTVVSAWLTYRQISALLETIRSIAHTHEALTAMEALRANFVEAENARRGYVIAGARRYLELYDTAGKEVVQTLERLRPLTSDNPNQQQRLGFLNALFHESSAQWQHSIDLQNAEGFYPEVQIALTGRGQDLLQQGHWMIEMMKAEEETLLKRRQELVEERSRGIYATILPLTGLQLGVLSLLLSLVIRDGAVRRDPVASPLVPMRQSPKHGRPRLLSSVLNTPLAARLPLHILVADDNLVNQRVALHLLGQLGYQPDVVGSGREVMEALSRQRYDIVLMDVQMPELDGLEATRLIHRQTPTGIRPRIIAMTANATPEDREVCLAAGMDDYITKPLHLERLEAVLVKWGESPTSPADRPQTSEPAADEFAALIQLRAMQPAGDSDIVTELIDLFLEDTPPQLETLRQAVQRSDPGALEQAGHSLKGSCAMIGAERMADLCAELERLGRAQTVIGADGVLMALDAEFGRVRDLLARLRQSP
jgi:CheY-like chemotaxis protein